VTPALSAEIANAIARNIAVDDVFLSQLTMTERAGFELLKTWIVSPATAPLVPSSPDMQITDRALANQRAQQAYAERVAFDVQYVAKRSIWLDLSILLKTAKVLVLQDGK
jgi:Bacterial sugar transferase